MSVEITNVDSGSSDDESAVIIESNKPQVSMPLPLVPRPELYQNPLGVPLINTTHSIAYELTGSTMDPFSNLIRVLHQSEDRDMRLFYELTHALAIGAKPSEFHSIFITLISQNYSTAIQHLSIKSMLTLSVNDPDFSKKIVEHTDLLISMLNQEEFIIEILELFASISDVADEESGSKMLKYISDQKLCDSSKLLIRVHSYSIIAGLSHFGNLLDPYIIEQIVYRCNYIAEVYLQTNIVAPCLVCIDNIIKQPGTVGYNSLIEKTARIVGKLMLAVVHSSKTHDSQIKILSMKVLMETADEFGNEEIFGSLYFQLMSALISMAHFAEPIVRPVAQNLLNHFRLNNDNQNLTPTQ